MMSRILARERNTYTLNTDSILVGSDKYILQISNIAMRLHYPT